MNIFEERNGGGVGGGGLGLSKGVARAEMKGINLNGRRKEVKKYSREAAIMGRPRRGEGTPARREELHLKYEGRKKGGRQ